MAHDINAQQLACITPYGFGPASVTRYGSTLPPPMIPGWFRQVKAGRDWLFKSNGTEWIPFAALTETTIYVSTTGQDSPENGHATGSSAYLTLDYAWSQLPPLLYAQATINWEAGTYADAVMLKGKHCAGDFSIVVQGVLNTYASTITADASSAQGGGTVQGTVVRASGTWSANEIQNKLIKWRDNTTTAALQGTYLIVDSNTTTTATMVGAWADDPVGTDTFDVLDWGNGTTATFLEVPTGTALTVNNPGGKIELRDLWIDGVASNFSQDWRSTVDGYRLRISGESLFYTPAAIVNLNQTLMDYAGVGVVTNRIITPQRSDINIYASKLTMSVDGTAIHAEFGTKVLCGAGTILEGTGASSVRAISINYGSQLFLFAANQVRIRNWARGIYVDPSSTAAFFDSTNVVYSSNTVNTSVYEIFTAKLASDHSVSSATGTQVTGLDIASLVPGTYIAEYFLIVQSANAGVGLGFGLNFTGTAVRQVILRYSVSTATTTTTGVIDDISNNLTGAMVEGWAARAFSTTTPNMLNTGVATLDQDIYVKIEAVIEVSATGNLELWHSSDSAVATRVESGSTVRVTRVNE